MAISKPRGPVPKRESERRRVNKPESHGQAETTAAFASGRPDGLGFDAHPIVQDLWDVLSDSAEAAFYSAADWQRVRLELYYASHTLSAEKISSMAWSAVQSGLSELLISPADKRRAGIDMKPQTVDPAADAADVKVADLAERLRAV